MGGENQLTGTWAREQGSRVGRGAGRDGEWVGACPRAEDRWPGEGRLSTTDPGAGAGRKCRSWCEEGPRAGAEASGNTIRWNRPPREDRTAI